MKRSAPQPPEDIPMGMARAGQSLPERFTEVAARFPEAPAISGDSGTRSYHELDLAANRVAQLLLAAEGPGNAPVALLFHHEPALVTALLGVLKAGKAWVALDRHAPAAWQRRQLAASGVRTVLTRRGHAADATAIMHEHQRIVHLDDADDLPIRAVELPRVDPAAVACILYTSGTTGEPRGVAFRHDSLLLKTRHDTAAFRLTPQDRIMLPFSPGSVAGVGGILRALLNGAALALYDIRTRGVEALPAWLSEQGVTIFHSVPTVFRRFARLESAATGGAGVRLFLLAGEPLYARDLELFRRIGGAGSLLVNLFGSTEAPGFCYFTVTPDMHLADGVVPVGRPLADTDLRILDAQDREAPAGRTGRIAVRNPFMAAGYWLGGPDGPCIEAICDGEGFHHLGDLGRRREDGLLEHRGRADDLVKIAGTRISIIEVEAALGGLSEVAEAAVVAVTRPDGSTRLASYIVPTEPCPLDVTEIRRRLRERLPETMIPAEFVIMDSLPLTPTGKVDRRALGAVMRPAVPGAADPPGDDVERRLAAIWRDLLGEASPGVHDDFFALGGDSLRALSLVSRIREGFGVELPVRVIFEIPTLGELSGFIRLLGECEDV